MALSVVPGSDKKKTVSLRAEFINSKIKTLQIVSCAASF